MVFSLGLVVIPATTAVAVVVENDVVVNGKAVEVFFFIFSLIL
jgi:hypothetical protein